MGIDDRRAPLWLFALLVGVAFCLVRSVHAIDTTQCGYLRCEGYFANANPRDGQTGHECSECPDSPSHNICGYAIGSVNGFPYRDLVGSFGACQCDAQPPIGPGVNFANPNGEFCRAGCLYKPYPNEPMVCTPHNLLPGANLVCEEQGTGWYAPGQNCNPVVDPEPTPPPTDPNCDADGYCIQPLIPPPPDIPKICSSGPSGDRGCAPLPDGCGSGPGGYTCVGNPPPDPPPPDPPNVNPPPDFGPPPGIFCAAGVCGPITITGGGPPGPAGCPAGTHGVPPQCVPDAHPCPDGTPAVNGTCAAPPGTCADGTHPVNGTCNAPPGPGGGVPGPDGECPENTTEYNGVCYGDCANGLPSSQGMCPPQVAPCPSGATPVAGRCPVGEPCDPQTDPNHCGDGHNASGGETCGAPPACTGDAILCMNVYQTWKTRCEISKLNPDQRPQDADYGQQFAPSAAWGSSDGDGGDGSTLDGSGWLGGNGQCPELPTVSLMGHSFAMSEWVPCSVMHILSVLILLGGYVQAAFIIGGRK